MGSLCLIGILSNCVPWADPTQYTGGILRFYELLSVIGILAASFTFIETRPLRRFLFLRFRRAFALATYTSVLCLVIAFALPFIPGDAWPLLGYPYAWRIAAILSISGALFFLFHFSIYYSSKHYLFPRYKSPRQADFMNSLGEFSIAQSPSEENYSAFCFLLHCVLDDLVDAIKRFDKGTYDHAFYLRRREWLGPGDPQKIFEASCQGTKKQKIVTQKAIQLVDQLVADPNFCAYLVRREYGLLIRIFDLFDKNKLWRSGGEDFFAILSKQLFENPESIARKEIDGRWYHAGRELLNKLLDCHWLLASYPILDGDLNIKFSIQKENVELVIWVAHEALRRYFLEPQWLQERPPEEREHILHTWEIPSPRYGYRLARLIHRLGEMRIMEDNQEVDFAVSSFFREIPSIFAKNYGGQERKIYISSNESTFGEHSIMKQLAQSVFDRLDGTLRLPESEWNWYTRAVTELGWLLFPLYSNPPDIILWLREKVLAHVKKSVEHDQSRSSPRNISMIRLLMWIYGWKLNREEETDYRSHPIFRYTEDSFNGSWAQRFLSEPDFARQHLPNTQFAIRNGKIIDTRHEDSEVPLSPVTH